MEETLTIAKLGVPAALRTFLVTTNAIENLIGSTRRTSRNVTRWRSGEMIGRWTGVGLIHAEQSFRRIRGYRNLPLLKHALSAESSKLDVSGRLHSQMRVAAALLKFHTQWGITAGRF